MGPETYAQLLHCLQHGLTVTFDNGDIEHDRWFGDVADVFANVEPPQFLAGGGYFERRLDVVAAMMQLVLSLECTPGLRKMDESLRGYSPLCKRYPQVDTIQDRVNNQAELLFTIYIDSMRQYEHQPP